ncbi:MAG: hypothetical protein E7052_06630 [Lentisphaerae bacterium]|nr:hypothetical protein [Lentisphaerota bacterium]
MRKFWVSVFLLLTTISLKAERSASVIYSDTEVMLDGKLNEACWQQKSWQQDFTITNTANKAVEPTFFKVVNTPRGIYVAVQAHDKKIISKLRKHDESVWHDDSIEIVVAPTAEFPSDENVREAAHFIVNADGSRFDSYMTAGNDNSAWDPAWSAASQRTEQGFTLEIFLPFSLFSDRNMEPGKWRFNLLRTHKGGQVTLYSAWNPARSASDTSNYGVLENIRFNPHSFKLQLGTLRFGKSVINNSACTVLQIPFKAEKNTLYDVSAMIYAPDKTFANFDHCQVQSDANGVVNARLNANFNTSGSCRVRLAIADENGKIFDRMLSLQAQLAPIELTVLHPVYRNTLFSSDPDRKIKLRLKIESPDKLRENSSLLIETNDDSGKVFDSQVVSNPPQVYDYIVDVKNIQPGILTVKCSIDRQKNWVVRHEFYIAPRRKTGSEVYIANNGNLFINGKPFMVRGFMGAYKDFDDMQQAQCNTVHFYTLNRQDIPQIIERLDQCQKQGLYAILSPFYKTSAGFFGVRRNGKEHPFFNALELERMSKLVEAIKDHPALLGYYTFDEPRGSEWIGELAKTYDILKKLDPYHPVLGADNGAASCIELQKACDIIALDMYLNPAHNGEPLRPVSMILNAVEQINTNLLPGKLLLYVPQAYDVDSFMPADFVRKHRPPSAAESAATVFGSLAAGARGILAYKIGNKSVVKPGVRHSNAGIYADEVLRKTYLEYLMPELARNEQFFLTPGPAAAAQNGKRQMVRIMPDGTRRSMIVSEKKNYSIIYK